MTPEKQSAASPAGLVSMVQASALVGLSDERIRQLARQGYVPQPVRGMIPLVGLVQGVIRFYLDPDRRANRWAVEARLRETKTREVEQRIAARDARLIDVVETKDVVSEAIDELRDETRTLPASIANPTIRARVEGELADIFARVETQLAKVMGRLRATRKAGHSP